MPLLATQGVKWNEENTNITPTLNLTVKSNIEPSKPIVGPLVTDIQATVIPVIDESASFFDSVESDTNRMAQQSDALSVSHNVQSASLIDSNKVEGGRPDSSTIDNKEEESPSSKFSEKESIDNIPIL